MVLNTLMTSPHFLFPVLSLTEENGLERKGMKEGDELLHRLGSKLRLG